VPDAPDVPDVAAPEASDATAATAATGIHRIAALIDSALAAPLGSAVALSIGDGGVEQEHLVRGATRRVPDAGPAIDEHTRFDLASLTKPMATAALAMVLVGDGALDLDDPVRRWLPEASTTGSVRHLLGHAAGCAAHVEFFRTLRSGAHADPRAELVDLAARHPAGIPGTEAVYSDLGYIVLGAIVERAADLALDDAFRVHIAEPLGLSGARFPGGQALPGAVATELDDRGVVTGRVHDENAYFGGGICGHAGLFATLGDVAAFAAALVDTAAGHARGRLRPDIVRRFLADAPVAAATWRLGWDAPSPVPGISHAGDRWPRAGAGGHTGFTGTSLWLDLPRRRWVALLTNRVHPTRHGTADAIKALRRSVGDAAVDLLDRAA
jgi:CubicO group peptidase (beta-lactamase class C family)